MRALHRRDTIAHASIEVLTAVTGALGGGAIGILAGPVGVVLGACTGALIGGLVSHQAELERHEKDLHERELDDIDVELEFFKRAQSPA